ncbi:Uncharacterized protein TCAP_03798 [Tolypocladium capitatum]|uniref:Transcription factor domain-containing protein n=1 Tax=Tolypocladium capitatum TaxID=45235 RepID=A0A2K3QFF1_9HYPO|nr:Uncharacterized protein TCAP_03798 [Tolypocladium capitatum]
MDTIQDAWPVKRRPNRHDSHEDQSHPDTSLLHDFKAALLCQEGTDTARDFFRGAPDGLIARLQGESVEPSFPLNLFNRVDDQPPPTEDMVVWRLACLSRFQSKVPFLHTLSPHLFHPCPRYLALSIASLGAVTLAHVRTGHSIWNLASKSLMATLALDNRQTRNTNVPLSIVRRIWTRPDDAASESIPMSTDRSCIIFYLVMIDTLRSLHYGMPASSMRAFGDVPLELPYKSLSSLASRTFFAGPQAEWPPFTPDNSLAMLILILNQILVWAREMTPLALGSQTASSPPRPDIENERLRCLIRIERALERWEECYMGQALPETQAFFFFCKMHLCAPHIHLLAVCAQYEPLAQLSPTSSERASTLIERDAGSMEDAAHFSWLVLEHVPESPDATAIWLPIILYFAGLIVWRNITSQGLSRSHGSLRVLQLFRQKLACMPWPCCAAFSQNLEVLARS